MYSCPEKHHLSQPGINIPVGNVLITSGSDGPFHVPLRPKRHFLGVSGAGAGQGSPTARPGRGIAYPGQRLGFDTIWLPGPGALHLINLAAKRRAVNRVAYRRALDSIVHWN